jgi:hypothetical protein
MTTHGREPKIPSCLTTSRSKSGTDRERALARLHKKRDFQGHVVAYVVVNAALWTVWGITGGGYP